MSTISNNITFDHQRHWQNYTS